MIQVQAFAAKEARGALTPFEYELLSPGERDVDVRVENCGICHSDLSMRNNDWGITRYPFVPGHEAVGVIEKLGASVKHLRIGQRVGVGWYSGSCLSCRTCMGGDHNLCDGAEQTIVGRHGGFASHVRVRAEWATPLPEGMDVSSAGPLFCGGITVFNPIVQYNVKPTDRVGVIGIGGLGHLALQFLNKWGCEVTAFTSTASKEAEARRLGAHHVVNPQDAKAMTAEAGRYDFILNTANVAMEWEAFFSALKAKGRLHTVGVVTAPIPAMAFTLIGRQRSLSGSPLGSPATVAQMLDFCTRHRIAPMAERFAMRDVNRALEHLEAGKARYRIVLEN